MDSFEALQNKLHQYFKFMGLNSNLVEASSEEETLFQKACNMCQFAFAILSYLNVALHIVTELIFCFNHWEKDYLLKTATCGMLMITSFVGMEAIFLVYWHKGTKEECLQKCARLHHLTDETLKLVFRDKLQKALDRCFFLMQCLTSMGLVGAFFLIFGGLFLGGYIEKEAYPTPYMSVFYIDNHVTYVLVFVHQTWATFTVTSCYLFHASLFLFNFVYIFAQFDAAFEIVGKMDDLDHETWKRLVVGLISDIKDHIEPLKTSIELYVVSVAKLVFVILFNTWVIYHIQPTMIGYCFGAFSVPLMCFVFTVINEEFAERFERLNRTVYEQNWYQMPPRNRKDFVFILQSTQKSILMSEGGVHDITYSWFADLVKQGYNGGLFLQRMLD